MPEAKKATLKVELSDRTVELQPVGRSTINAIASPPKAIRGNTQAVFALHLNICDRQIITWIPKPGAKVRPYYAGAARSLSPADIETIIQAMRPKEKPQAEE